MSGLTYEQAKAALDAGATLRWVTCHRRLRRADSFSDDAGATWVPQTSEKWMLTCDGVYEIHTPARDYRAERDALRLRLDEALDRVDGLRSDSVGMGVASARIRQLEAEVERLREREHTHENCRAAKHADTLRALATADANLCGAVAVDSDVLLELLDAWQAKRTPPAPKWPAVGETAAWSTVWDHLKAEPRARYEAGQERRVFVLRWGHLSGNACVVTDLESAFAWFKDNVSSSWKFTRLPDAETP